MSYANVKKTIRLSARLGQILLFCANRCAASLPSQSADSKTLSLEVAVCDEDTPTRKSSVPFGAKLCMKIFQTAARTFRLVALFLREVGPRIIRFELFGRTQGPTRCNLHHDTFSQLDWKGSKQHWTPFRTLKAMSLSLSDRFMAADLKAYSSTGLSDTEWKDNTLKEELEADARHLASQMKC